MGCLLQGFVSGVTGQPGIHCRRIRQNGGDTGTVEPRGVIQNAVSNLSHGIGSQCRGIHGIRYEVHGGTGSRTSGYGSI
jgi:hypothetical protein